MTRGGFPHSEISGSKPVCGSPELFAAYHVLHRLLAPRHSPYALSSLTIRTHELPLSVLSPWCLIPARAVSPGATFAHEGGAARTVNQGPDTEIQHREFLEKHCVLGRNYHLQDIQLSKSGTTKSIKASGVSQVVRLRLAAPGHPGSSDFGVTTFAH